MKNPFAELDREKAIRDCRAETLEYPGMTPELVEHMMQMQVQALDYLCRIPPAGRHPKRLKDTLDFTYPNFMAAKRLYEQKVGKPKDEKPLAASEGGAKGSQPIRSGSQQTPPATGSGRAP